MYTVEEMVELKKKYGLSYEFISERSGVSLSTVQKVLGGINKNPRRNTLESLSAFFEQYGKPRFVYSTRDDKPDIDQLREEAPYYTKGSSARMTLGVVRRIFILRVDIRMKIITD